MRRTGILTARSLVKGTLTPTAVALSIAAAGTFSVWAQAPYDGCRDAVAGAAQIEVLSLISFPLKDDTCRFTNNTVTDYGSPCDLSNGLHYSKPEAIYKVWLHPGNNVGFRLNVISPADLALALIGTCGHGESCVKSSKDPFGSVEELISKRAYPPGFYYLLIDASNAPGKCGKYELTVFGDNPVPDLAVTLSGSPKIVRMNDTLTYNLSVTNAGLLDATGVTVIVTFPPGVTVPTVSGCPPMGPKTIACPVGSLPKLSGSTFKKTIAVKVVTSTPGALSSTATATALDMGQKLGDQNPANNQATDTTTVRARIRPGHRRQAPRPLPR